MDFVIMCNPRPRIDWCRRNPVFKCAFSADQIVSDCSWPFGLVGQVAAETGHQFSRGETPPGGSTFSRTTSFASLSPLSPRKTGWRRRLSRVHSANLSWQTRIGSTQWQRFISDAVIGLPYGPLRFSGRSAKGHRSLEIFLNWEKSVRSRFSLKPVPTLPANLSSSPS